MTGVHMLRMTASFAGRFWLLLREGNAAITVEAQRLDACRKDIVFKRPGDQVRHRCTGSGRVPAQLRGFDGITSGRFGPLQRGPGLPPSPPAPSEELVLTNCQLSQDRLYSLYVYIEAATARRCKKIDKEALIVELTGF